MPLPLPGPDMRHIDWANAIATPGGGVDATLTALRRARTRGPQKSPTKIPTTIRFDADVLAALKATGNGRQTRVNEVLREWINNPRRIEDR
ncbi:MAG: BrnA antitoxin family protein [Candidatus Competibacteraceae bacterium]